MTDTPTGVLEINCCAFWAVEGVYGRSGRCRELPLFKSSVQLLRSRQTSQPLSTNQLPTLIQHIPTLVTYCIIFPSRWIQLPLILKKVEIGETPFLPSASRRHHSLRPRKLPAAFFISHSNHLPHPSSSNSATPSSHRHPYSLLQVFDKVSILLLSPPLSPTSLVLRCHLGSQFHATELS